MNRPATPRIAIVGAGPAGLMAAEVLAGHGANVDIFDAMPSAGRKFLLAGRGGLNLTHSEALEPFVARYGDGAGVLRPWLQAFGPEAVRAWAAGLGVETFVGTSGRVFPRELKAAPLLRAWLRRLHGAGVRLHTRHRWLGWQGQPAGGVLRFAGPQGEAHHAADATLLALGGASWPRMGSDGAWLPLLRSHGVAVAPLQPANCGFDALGSDGQSGWSAYLAERFAGQPIKSVVASLQGEDGLVQSRKGEFVLTSSGIEGSLVYAFSVALRGAIARHGSATLTLDLLPDHSGEQVLAETTRGRGARSLATHLKTRLGIHGIKLALLHEVLGPAHIQQPATLAAALKALPVVLGAPRPLAEAISTAGGVRFDGLDAGLMLHALPGVFCAGEMLDWEAPTGGYLLTACLASGRVAGLAMLAWLQSRRDGCSSASASASATSMPSTPADMMPPA